MDSGLLRAVESSRDDDGGWELEMRDVSYLF